MILFALSPVLSLLVVVVAGYVIMRMGLIPNGGIKTMTALVLLVATPAISISKMQREPTPTLVHDLIVTFCLGIVLMLAFGLLGYIVFRKAPSKYRRLYTHLCIFSNCGYMGYPVIMALLGDDFMIYAVVFNAAFNILAWTLGVFLMGGSDFNIKKLMTPALVGSVLGVVLFAFRVSLPSFLVTSLDSMGSLTTPLSMLVIGANMTLQKPRNLLKPLMFIIAALRLLAFPAITFAICSLIGVSYDVRVVVTLLLGMPIATISAMQAEYYGSDSAFASGCVALSTTLSMATIPIMCLVMGINSIA